uniref:Uncharacterized protein n=1 Tax=Tetranychus urticae TaxID=32264 RepID=T1KR80_TETUR
MPDMIYSGDMFKKRPLLPKVRAMIYFCGQGHPFNLHEADHIIHVFKEFLAMREANRTRVRGVAELRQLIGELEENRPYWSVELRQRMTALIEMMT